MDLRGEADAMLRLDERGFDIVMHVHDEVVVERHDPCVVAYWVGCWVGSRKYQLIESN